MVDKVLKTIRKHNLIEPGDSVIVGVSGGVDSVCLLHVLRSIAGSINARFFAVHINHMLRGEESDCDELYVRELCKSLDVELYVSKHDVKGHAQEKGISIEEAGREIRYRVFEEYADKTSASRIAVAHNRNDQAETVLMNIIRGTGLEGLKGMEYRKGRIIRPLLDIPRAEIEEYCRKHSLNPRIDSSNLEIFYTRNKVRLELIPYIDRLFGTNTVESVFRMSSLLKDDNDFIEKNALAFYNESKAAGENGAVMLSLAKLREAHPSLMKRAVRYAIKEVRGSLRSVQSVHIDNVIDLCLYGRSGSKICLPGRIYAEKSYKTLKIARESSEQSCLEFEKEVVVPGTTYIDEIGAVIETSVEKKDKTIEENYHLRYDSYIQFFDYDRLGTGICIRNRKNGDIFKPFGSSGSKKLKEYFIDMKIPRAARNAMPLIAKGKEIVWVIGFRTSEKYKVSKDTENILKITYRKTNSVI